MLLAEDRFWNGGWYLVGMPWNHHGQQARPDHIFTIKLNSSFSKFSEPLLQHRTSKLGDTCVLMWQHLPLSKSQEDLMLCFYRTEQFTDRFRGFYLFDYVLFQVNQAWWIQFRSEFLHICSSTHHHGWRCPASRAHQSQSECHLQCRRQGSMRGPGNPPLHRMESCHHGNQRQRRSWCQPPSPRSWSPSTAPPEWDVKGAEWSEELVSQRNRAESESCWNSTEWNNLDRYLNSINVKVKRS